MDTKKLIKKQSYFTDREMILIKVLKEQFTKMMNEQEIVLKNQIKKELRNSDLIKSLIKEVINENRTTSNNSIISKKQIIQKQNNQKQELLKKTYSKDPLINNILKNTVNELTSNDFEDDDEEDFDEDYARQNQIITQPQKKQAVQKIVNNIESTKKQIPEKLNTKLNNFRSVLEEQFNSTEDNTGFIEDQQIEQDTQQSNNVNDVDITNIASFLGNKNMKDFALKHQSRPSSLKIEDTEII
jgi:hypothetical protein